MIEQPENIPKSRPSHFVTRQAGLHVLQVLRKRKAIFHIHDVVTA